jgi:osmotically-inducible protein OsmY
VAIEFDVFQKISQGRIPSMQNLQNHKIERNIRHAFELGFHSDFDDVEVKVDGGSVRLSGQVNDSATHKAVIDIVGNTPGVVNIVDNIEVTGAIS